MSNQYISNRKAHLATVGLAVCKINHDLRNILASAQLISDQLSQVEDPTVQRLAPKLIASLDRAIALCSITIRYGRAREAAPQRRRMALAPMVEEVADLLGLIEHKEIDWTNAVAPNIEIDADPDHLFRALLNLCLNAMAALDKTGRRRKEVRVCARRDGAVCTIEVRDTGPGVPEKARDHLFQPFQSSARPDGSGLGLAIAAELVRAHGGDIRLVDSHTRDGVCFRITIPDSVGDAEAAVDKPMVAAAGIIAFRTRAGEVRDAAGAAPAPKRHRSELRGIPPQRRPLVPRPRAEYVEEIVTSLLASSASTGRPSSNAATVIHSPPSSRWLPKSALTIA